jgi:hypothetical protein
MNRYFFIALLLLSSCRLTTENEQITTEMVITGHEDDGRVAGATFEEEVYKFGTIAQGELVDFTFKFKNTGKIPLVIAAVKPACGCTLINKWPKTPIAPGEEAEIPVRFNSADQKGHISKSVTMVANTKPKTTVLYFEGEVIAMDTNQE